MVRKGTGSNSTAVKLLNIGHRNSHSLSLWNSRSHFIMRNLSHETEKENFTAHELFTWQLKSKTSWAAQGDANTKYFHSIALGHMNQNAIWYLKDDEDNLVEDDGSLKDLGIKHFSQIFKFDN